MKLTDFGIACVYDENEKPTLRCGTSIALAPEVIEGLEYTPKIDCWSIGIMMYELLSNQLPFYSDKPEILYTQILEDEVNFSDGLWSNVSDEAKDLAKDLLQKDPDCRLCAKDALKHPWFADIRETGHS